MWEPQTRQNNLYKSFIDDPLLQAYQGSLEVPPTPYFSTPSPTNRPKLKPFWYTNDTVVEESGSCKSDNESYDVIIEECDSDDGQSVQKVRDISTQMTPDAEEDSEEG